MDYTSFDRRYPSETVNRNKKIHTNHLSHSNQYTFAQNNYRINDQETQYSSELAPLLPHKLKNDDNTTDDDDDTVKVEFQDTGASVFYDFFLGLFCMWLFYVSLQVLQVFISKHVENIDCFHDKALLSNHNCSADDNSTYIAFAKGLFLIFMSIAPIFVIYAVILVISYPGYQEFEELMKFNSLLKFFGVKSYLGYVYAFTILFSTLKISVLNNLTNDTDFSKIQLFLLDPAFFFIVQVFWIILILLSKIKLFKTYFLHPVMVTSDTKLVPFIIEKETIDNTCHRVLAAFAVFFSLPIVFYMGVFDFEQFSANREAYEFFNIIDSIIIAIYFFWLTISCFISIKNKKNYNRCILLNIPITLLCISRSYIDATFVQFNLIRFWIPVPFAIVSIILSFATLIVPHEFKNDFKNMIIEPLKEFFGDTNYWSNLLSFVIVVCGCYIALVIDLGIVDFITNGVENDITLKVNWSQEIYDNVELQNALLSFDSKIGLSEWIPIVNFFLLLPAIISANLFPFFAFFIRKAKVRYKVETIMEFVCVGILFSFYFISKLYKKIFFDERDFGFVQFEIVSKSSELMADYYAFLTGLFSALMLIHIFERPRESDNQTTSSESNKITSLSVTDEDLASQKNMLNETVQNVPQTVYTTDENNNSPLGMPTSEPTDDREGFCQYITPRLIYIVFYIIIAYFLSKAVDSSQEMIVGQMNSFKDYASTPLPPTNADLDCKEFTSAQQDEFDNFIDSIENVINSLITLENTHPNLIEKTKIEFITPGFIRWIIILPIFLSGLVFGSGYFISYNINAIEDKHLLYICFVLIFPSMIMVSFFVIICSFVITRFPVPFYSLRVGSGYYNMLYAVFVAFIGLIYQITSLITSPEPPVPPVEQIGREKIEGHREQSAGDSTNQFLSEAERQAAEQRRSEETGENGAPLSSFYF